jgi:hypothetical protein
MGFSFRLHKVKCLTESDESSDADEPYVLVTAIDLNWTSTPPVAIPGAPAPPPLAPMTSLYGKWTNFDEGEELVLIGEQPFWEDPPERELNLASTSRVFFVVTLMEQDHGSPESARLEAQAAAIAAVPLTIGMSTEDRISRIVADIRGAVSVLPLDNHVDTKSVRIDASDVGMPAGSWKDKVVKIDADEGKWELTLRWVHHRRVVFPDPTHLAAVTRNASKMEIWGVASDGLVHGNWFEGRWHGWYALPGHEFGPDTHLTAVSRHPDHMEVWGVDRDGIVHGNWYDGEKWTGWYGIGGAQFPPGAPLAVVSRDPDHIDLFGVDNTRNVRHISADTTAWAPGWRVLGGQQFPAGTHLAAASLSPDHMEVWVVGADGSHPPILGNRWDGDWAGWYSLGNVAFPPTRRIAALRRHYNLAVFAIDENGHLRDQWYDGTSWRGWYQVGTESWSPDAPVAACTQHATHMNVFTVGAADSAQTNAFDVTAWQGWAGVQSLLAEAPSGLAALSRFEGHMEVWGVRLGLVGGCWFDGISWRGPYQLLWSFEA